MKRSRIERRTPLRRTAFRWTPDEEGSAYNRRVIGYVRERDRERCVNCGRPGTDCAHVIGLGMGGNRRNPNDRRNHPPNRVMLCRECHRVQTEVGNLWWKDWLPEVWSRAIEHVGGER